MRAADFERVANIATVLGFVFRTGRPGAGWIESALISAAGIRDEDVHARAQHLISIAMDIDVR